MSKIQIWKRITTAALQLFLTPALYLICQRYKFESESQQNRGIKQKKVAVFNMSKIQIWKRITTRGNYLLDHLWLYLICQRYKFESESQLSRISLERIEAVFNMSKIQIWKRITTGNKKFYRRIMLYLICQRYKFESESQLFLLYVACSSAVFNMSKIQIWKRITTIVFEVLFCFLLYLICQRYKFESESQHPRMFLLHQLAVFNMSKIQRTCVIMAG